MKLLVKINGNNHTQVKFEAYCKELGYDLSHISYAELEQLIEKFCKAAPDGYDVTRYRLLVLAWDPT